MLTVPGDCSAVILAFIVSRVNIVIGISKFYPIDVKRFLAFSVGRHRMKIFDVSFYRLVLTAIVCTNGFGIHIKLKYKNNYR